MNINLVSVILVLDNELNPDIRKNDIKSLKLLVNKKKELISIPLNKRETIKDVVKTNIANIISTNKFHLEQVYTLGEEDYYLDNAIDVIYLAITNRENIKKIADDYELVDFSIVNNIISFDGNDYNYKTKEKISNNNIEYYHIIDTDSIQLEKELLEIIIAYKHLRSKIDSSDVIFKFMKKTFTLEEVRIVYELIKEVKVDKSNFRKKIMKYCEAVATETVKKGYRPSKTYTFKTLKGDIWL